MYVAPGPIGFICHMLHSYELYSILDALSVQFHMFYRARGMPFRSFA